MATSDVDCSDTEKECYTNPTRSVTSLSISAIDLALEEVSREVVPLPDFVPKGGNNLITKGGQDDGGAVSAGGGFTWKYPAGIYPYKSTASLDEFERHCNGMHRELSQDIIHIDVVPSDEYLESHQFHGTRVVDSLSRQFTEDEDENTCNMRPCPVLSMSGRAKSYVSLHEHDSQVSVKSSVTDYGELFPDGGRIEEYKSCENNFTDDEVAGGWHMFTLDRDEDYEMFNQPMHRPTKANEKILPCPSEETLAKREREKKGEMDPEELRRYEEELRRKEAERLAREAAEKMDKDCKKSQCPNDDTIMCKRELAKAHPGRTFSCYRQDPNAAVKPSSRRSTTNHRRSSRRASDEYEEDEPRRSRRHRRRNDRCDVDLSDEQEMRSSRRSKKDKERKSAMDEVELSKAQLEEIRATRQHRIEREQREREEQERMARLAEIEREEQEKKAQKKAERAARKAKKQGKKSYLGYGQRENEEEKDTCNIADDLAAPTRKSYSKLNQRRAPLDPAPPRQVVPQRKEKEVSESAESTDDEEYEEVRRSRRRSSRHERRHRRRTSRGDFFLKSLQEANNICFFRNPYYNEELQQIPTPPSIQNQEDLQKALQQQLAAQAPPEEKPSATKLPEINKTSSSNQSVNQPKVHYARSNHNPFYKCAQNPNTCKYAYPTFQSMRYGGGNQQMQAVNEMFT